MSEFCTFTMEVSRPLHLVVTKYREIFFSSAFSASLPMPKAKMEMPIKQSYISEKNQLGGKAR